MSLDEWHWRQRDEQLVAHQGRCDDGVEGLNIYFFSTIRIEEDGSSKWIGILLVGGSVSNSMDNCGGTEEQWLGQTFLFFSTLSPEVDQVGKNLLV